MKMGSLATLALAAFTLPACQSMQNLKRTARVDPASVSFRPMPEACDLGSSIEGDRAYSINIDCFKFQKTDGDTAYKMATSVADPDVRLSARNRLEAVLLTHADTICEMEKGNLYANRAIATSSLDFLSSGFSITSSIVGGDLAKSILSGLSGLSTATRTNVDANIYQNQIVPAVTKVMDAERSKILTTMQAKRTSSVADYPADEMIRMANSYHQACSFQKGMELLLDAAVNKEGVDRIIESINLRAANKLLEEEYARLENFSGQEAEEARANIVKKMGENALRGAQNAQDADATVLTTTVVEED